MPALISTIENFLDIHGKAARSGDFPQIYWKTKFWKNFESRVSLVAMATQYSTPCFVKFCFLTKHFKQTVILSLEIIYGAFFGTLVTLHMICDIKGIAQYLFLKIQDGDHMA